MDVFQNHFTVTEDIPGYEYIEDGYFIAIMVANQKYPFASSVGHTFKLYVDAAVAVIFDGPDVCVLYQDILHNIKLFASVFNIVELVEANRFDHTIQHLVTTTRNATYYSLLNLPFFNVRGYTEEYFFQFTASPNGDLKGKWFQTDTTSNDDMDLYNFVFMSKESFEALMFWEEVVYDDNPTDLEFSYKVLCITTDAPWY